MERRFKNWKKPHFDKNGWAYPNEISNTYQEFQHLQRYGWRCQNPEGLKLGNNTDVGCFTYMNAKYGIEIGDNTQIGSSCSIYSNNSQNNTNGPVKIGKDCLIGSHSLILPSSIIPDGTKIKAYSIVTIDEFTHKTIVLELKREKRYYGSS